MPGRKGGGGIGTPAQGRQPGGSALDGPPGITDPRLRPPNHTAPKPVAKPKEILRRQRLLKNLGYKVVVDGIWGPRSQKAWTDYLRRRSSGDLQRSPYRKEGAGGRAPISLMPGEKRPKGVAASVVTPEEARRERERKQEALRRERVRQQQEQRAAVLRRAEAIRRDPTVVRGMSFRQIAEVARDPEAKMGLATREGATAVQTWLRSRGYQVRVTGVYDAKTHDALEVAQKRFENAALRQRMRAITNRLYGDAGVQPGDKPAWFPLQQGVPTPKELDKILQQGGFTAQLVMKALLERGVDDDAIFNQWREAELRRLAASHNPILASLMKMGGQPNLLWVYSSILGANDLVPFPDWSEQSLDGLSLEEAVQLRSQSDKVREQNAQRVGSLRAEAKALMSAKDPQDFKRKLVQQLAVQEKSFTDWQASIAAERAGFFGKVANALLWPGERFREGYFWATANAAKLEMVDVGGGLMLPVYVAPEAKTLEETNKRWDEMNPVLRFGYEVVADPLNLVAPLRVTSTFVKFGTKGATLGSYKLVGGPRLWEKAIVYEAGTWSKRGVLDRAAIAAVGGSRFQPAYEKMLEEGRKLTQLRETAVAKASERVAVQIRHGFRRPADPAAAKGWNAKQPPKKLRDEIDSALVKVESWIEASTELAPFLDGAVEDGVSLFVDSSLTTYSNVGAALLANLTEKARVAAVHQLADDGVQDMMVALREQGLEREEIIAQVSEEYARLVEQAGVYITGGRGDKAFASKLFARTASRMDEIEYVLLPAFQRIIERRLEQQGLKLWDEGGLWVGRNGEAANTIRALGRETFDDAATTRQANPAHGVPHTHDEMLEAIEWEVRRGTPRIYNYQARGIAAGTLPDDFDARRAAEELRQEVVGAWEKRSDGFFYDTREFVETSALYSRHNGAAYEAVTAKALDMLRTGDTLDGLAVFPGIAANGPVDDALWRTMWTLGSRFKHEPMIEHPTRLSYTPGTQRGAVPSMDQESIEFRWQKYAEGRQFQEAVSGAKLALSKAADESLPRELVAERAYLVALQKAQGRHWKALYYALYGSMSVWRFVTLPLRPGWVVRNMVDNTAKALIRGVRDPRYFFVGGAAPGKMVRSIFGVGIAPLRQAVRFLDQLFGTNALEAFDGILARFWDLSSTVLNKVFKAHGLPPVPEPALDAARLRLGDAGRVTGGNPIKLSAADYDRAGLDVPRKLARAAADGTQRIGLAERLGEKIAKSPDTLWDLMAARPENYMKRVIYRGTFDKALRKHLADGMDDVEAQLLAHEQAWDEVTDTLFDYGAISVIEDNFKVFFPFVQFWRKNTSFWVKQFGEKPWLSLSVLKFDQERKEAHADLPLWMQRYIHADEIVDAAAFIPGLDRIVDAMLPEDAMFDPMSFASFAPLYRAYRDLAYGENQFLPGEDAGMKVIGPMLDAMNDWGLSMNPLVRKPLEWRGVASQRSWQRIFPQTPLIEAFSREFMGGIGADWPAAFERLLGGTSSDEIAENFEFYVQQEIAGQVARGEEPSRAKAEATIRGWFFIQNAYSYFGGVYWRRATPEDIYLAKLSEQDYADLSPEEKRLRQMWAMRGVDRLTYDRYLDMLPLIEAYYRTPEWGEREELAREHPELRRYVHRHFTGKPWSGSWVRNARRYLDTRTFFHALRVVEAVDPAPDVRQAALDVFASPELRRFWQENDTPSQIKQRQVKGEVARYYRELNREYFSIPATDYEARNGFIEEHPELVRWWNRNNDPADDAEAIMGQANADLREQYFDIVEKEGWEAGAYLLKRHPFMFEDTKSAEKVDEEAGEWKPGAGKWSAERVADFREAKPHLTWFFDTFMPKVGSEKAFAWLNDSKLEAAGVIRAYLKKYPSAKRIAWLRAAPWLKVFFGMPEAERNAWLRGDSEGAKVVRDYFERYGKKGMTQHARDYLSTKSELDFYFSMSREKRAEWLKSDDPRAAKVLDYFKKYGRDHAYERLLKRFPKLARGTPEQRRRLEFWRQYYALTPDKRPLFVLENAEAHGIFMYGEFGEAERHDDELEYMRRAVGLGINKRQAAFLYVRPLLNFYRTLDGSEKGMFLRANPELQEYFDKYSTKSLTGDKRLDSQVERYMKLPPDSFARSEFLRKHPRVQDWFDSRSSPAERAMRNLLEQYFSLSGWERSDFLLDHPEVQAYFEQRREERASEASIYQAFDDADPRLRPFFDTAADMERAAARMRERLARAAYDAVGGIAYRRERQPA